MSNFCYSIVILIKSGSLFLFTYKVVRYELSKSPDHEQGCPQLQGFFNSFLSGIGQMKRRVYKIILYLHLKKDTKVRIVKITRSQQLLIESRTVNNDRG